MSAAARVEVEIGGHALRLSNLDKVLYPVTGFTKGDAIDYVTRAAPALLAHLEGRALTMKRYPNGVDANFFYEKQAPVHRPGWAATEKIVAHGDGRMIDFLLVNELATLVWVTNLASIELHTSLALAEDPDTPTMVAFDLDPGAPATAVECCQVALMLRDVLAGVGLEAWAKSSGSKGVQVYVPLNTPAGYEQTAGFAKAVADLLERHHPELVTANMRKDRRTGRVLVDWSQNSRHKTTICVYSLRARERPTVSTPLHWDEVEACAAGDDPGAVLFTAPEVLARIEEHGDLFAPVLDVQQTLPGG